MQGQEEPYGQEAINYSKERVLQHEVSCITAVNRFVSQLELETIVPFSTC